MRNGPVGTPTTAAAPDIAGAVSINQLLDSIAVRINGPRAWDTTLTIDWTLTDQDVTHRTTLSNGTLIHHLASDPDDTAATTFTLTTAHMLAALGGLHSMHDLVASRAVRLTGDQTTLDTLLGMIDKPDPDFAIVTR